MTDRKRGAGRKPTDVDRIVGTNLKSLRRAAKITQAGLGEAIGLSFKQIRKYESGENRISASVLYLIAQVLNKPIDAFYEGISTIHADPAPIPNDEARELAALFSQIEKPHERKALLKLVSEISKSPLFSVDGSHP